MNLTRKKNTTPPSLPPPKNKKHASAEALTTWRMIPSVTYYSQVASDFD